MENKQRRKKKRIRKRTIYAIILTIMMICFLSIGVLLLFQTRKIKVSGNEHLTNEAVGTWVQKEPMASNTLYLMWHYNFGDYDLPNTIEDVKITLENPWTVNVHVTEKKAVGYIELKDELVYFDEKGLVLEKTQVPRDGVPKIGGLNVKKAKLYEELPVSKANKRAFKNLLTLSESLEAYELEPNRIVCQGSDLHLYFGKLCANVGHTNLKDRVAQITPIMKKLGNKKGTLHLENYGEGNVTISFEKNVYPKKATKK